MRAWWQRPGAAVRRWSRERRRAPAPARWRRTPPAAANSKARGSLGRRHAGWRRGPTNCDGAIFISRRYETGWSELCSRDASAREELCKGIFDTPAKPRRPHTAPVRPSKPASRIRLRIPSSHPSAHPLPRTPHPRIPQPTQGFVTSSRMNRRAPLPAAVASRTTTVCVKPSALFVVLTTTTLPAPALQVAKSPDTCGV